MLGGSERNTNQRTSRNVVCGQSYIFCPLDVARVCFHLVISVLGLIFLAFSLFFSNWLLDGSEVRGTVASISVCFALFVCSVSASLNPGLSVYSAFQKLLL